MVLVDRECVRRLLESADPNVALVFKRGSCVILPIDQIEDRCRTMVIVRRADIPDIRAGRPVTEERIESLAWCFDNMARDLGD
ncbi:hypothetical protein Pth03_53120 [Planotetraspora thailandica]|uniref:Uncharacterized protein n=1 Tax=Planotetraspora thailandica TaxID=487172 RepID=A0A8J3V3V7_9ACTN|nr:hypothetical protein [Planotetraspora thailandica]GII56923.1 hypothetical protein Pth03_53120 [Planotetraspora thailandica]